MILLTFKTISRLTEKESFKNIQCFEAFPLYTPTPKATVFGPFLTPDVSPVLPALPNTSPSFVSLLFCTLLCSKEAARAYPFPCPACISPEHVTANVEWLSGCWRFLYGERGRLKEIKEESCTAVIASLYLANNRAIIICENYSRKNTSTLGSLSCRHACHTVMSDRVRNATGKARDSCSCSEALLGDACLKYLDGR